MCARTPWRVSPRHTPTLQPPPYLPSAHPTPHMKIPASHTFSLEIRALFPVRTCNFADSKSSVASSVHVECIFYLAGVVFSRSIDCTYALDRRRIDSHHFRINRVRQYTSTTMTGPCNENIVAPYDALIVCRRSAVVVARIGRSRLIEFDFYAAMPCGQMYFSIDCSSTEIVPSSS